MPVKQIVPRRYDKTEEFWVVDDVGHYWNPKRNRWEPGVNYSVHKPYKKLGFAQNGAKVAEKTTRATVAIVATSLLEKYLEDLPEP